MHKLNQMLPHLISNGLLTQQDHITNNVVSLNQNDWASMSVKLNICSVINEIRLRWPSKTANWPSDNELSEAWLRSIMERTGAVGWDKSTLKKALAKYTNTKFAPEIQDLIEIVIKPVSISDDEIETSLRNLRRCMSLIPVPDYSLLSSCELWSLRSLRDGYYQFNQMAGAKQLDIWSNLMTKACNLPPEQLPVLIKKPVAVIPTTEQQKMEKKEISIDAKNRSGFAEMLSKLKSQTG